MKRRSKRVKLFIGVAMLIVVSAILVVAFIASMKSETKTKPDSTSQVDTQKESTPKDKESTEEPAVDVPVKTDEDAASIDPSTLATIEIAPAKLVISYVKGAGGFEYEVLRAKDGRRYIELRSSDLVGTKCDDDMGVFVTILESPNTSEQSTVTKTVDVEGTKYGLSVASPTCTDDAELLQKYQDAFTKPFSLLKKMN